MNDIYHLLSLKLLGQQKTNATKTWDPMLLHVVWNAPCAQEDSHCTQAFQLELPQKLTGIHHCLLGKCSWPSLQKHQVQHWIWASRTSGPELPSDLATVTLVGIVAAWDPLILEVPKHFRLVGFPSWLIRNLIQHPGNTLAFLLFVDFFWWCTRLLFFP